MTNRHAGLYIVATFLWAIYLVLGLTAPVAPSPYVISDTVRVLLNFSVAIPFLAVWLAGCYAGLTLLATVPSMKEKEDKTAFTRFAMGVFALVAARVLNTLVGAVRPYIVDDASVIATLTIVTNYIEILGPLVGFSFIFAGSLHLRRSGRTESAKLDRRETDTGEQGWAVALGFGLIAFAVAYVWLIFTNPSRQYALSASVPPTYYLPDALIVLTIIIPVLATCLLAYLSIYRLGQYYRGLTGAIYKQSTMNFISGFLFVIGGAILLQALLSLGTSRLLGVGIAPLLIAVYVFLALKTFGYLFLAFGARKLATIERVMQKYEAKESRS